MKQVASRLEHAKIKSFTDLNAWKKSHELTIMIYRISTEFPDSERFGITSQIRRSASSVGANIAEGFSRASIADKRHFYVMAHGSLSETQNFLLLARDVGYIDHLIFKNAADLSVETSKLVNGLIKSLSNKNKKETA